VDGVVSSTRRFINALMSSKPMRVRATDVARRAAGGEKFACEIL